MNLLERYQLVKDANEQVHAMVAGRTATDWEMSELKRFARLQGEILALQAEQDLKAVKAALKAHGEAEETSFQEIPF